MPDRPAVIDVFAGAGGMALGLSRAGFEIVAAVDADPHAQSTFSRNQRHHRGTALISAAIEELSAREVLSRANISAKDVAVVAGGPPCKGFSSANVKTRNGRNRQNALVDEFFRLVGQIRPRVFVMENVMGLIWFYKDFLNRCTHFRRLAKDGYSIDIVSMNALDYGVPQNRLRLFVIGNRLGRMFSHPPQTHGSGARRTPVTLREAILGDLPLRAAELKGGTFPYLSGPTSSFQKSIRGHAKTVHNHVITRNSDRVRLRMSKVPVGGNWRDIPPKFLGIRVSHSCLYKRLDPDSPSVTLGNFRKNMLIHPKCNRHLSLREAARLQSFPDDYYFDGPVTLMQQQIADATPPLLARAVGKEIMKWLAISKPHALRGTHRRNATQEDGCGQGGKSLRPSYLSLSFCSSIGSREGGHVT
jgi:DNA (cytosine-5)-methyltransferase 1